MSRRMAIVWIAIVLLLGVLIALVPRAESTESTLALRRFLAASGRQVSEGGPPPEAGGTYVILHDLRTPDEARSLLAWAASGGRLVVADPRSPLVTLSGASVGDPVGLVGARSLEPACLAEEALGVRSIVVRASDRSLRGGDRFVSCFDGHFLVRSHDRGTLVLLGGFTALTNEHLRTADNALLALRLAGSEGPVVFGPPVPAEVAAPATGVWGALPERAKVGDPRDRRRGPRVRGAAIAPAGTASRRGTDRTDPGQRARAGHLASLPAVPGASATPRG